MKESDNRQAGRPRQTARGAEFSSSSSLARPFHFDGLEPNDSFVGEPQAVGLDAFRLAKRRFIFRSSGEAE